MEQKKPLMKIIKEALDRKDQNINIFISADGNTNINIFPHLKETPHWIEEEHSYDSKYINTVFICSECGRRVGRSKYLYCPSCGAQLSIGTAYSSKEKGNELER